MKGALANLPPGRAGLFRFFVTVNRLRLSAAAIPDSPEVLKIIARIHGRVPRRHGDIVSGAAGAWPSDGRKLAQRSKRKCLEEGEERWRRGNGERKEEREERKKKG